MDQTVENCITVLQNASSDNERLAGLLMIAKAVKAQECDGPMRRRIFEAVGFKFLIRLLRTDKVPEGCTSIAYKGIAVTILSCFCTDSELVCHPQMLGCIQYLNEIIVSVPGDNSDNEYVQLINDSYDCLSSIAVESRGREALLKKHAINSLCEAYTKHMYGCSKAFELLQYLNHECGRKTWHNNEYGLHLLLTQLATEVKENKDDKKFELCKIICNILSTVDKENIDERSNKWKWSIHAALFSILQSKIGETQRNPSLQLASLMIELCGVPWAFGPDQTERKLLLLLVHLTCIEVRMILEDNPLPQVEQKQNLLSCCYIILEQIISYMTAGPSLLLDDRQIQQLHAAMRGAFNAVLYFLARIQEQPEQMLSAVVVASVRVLGSWIAEETTALKDEVINLLPFLLTVSQKTLEAAKKLESRKGTGTSDRIPTSTDCVTDNNSMCGKKKKKEKEVKQTADTEENTSHLTELHDDCLNYSKSSAANDEALSASSTEGKGSKTLETDQSSTVPCVGVNEAPMELDSCETEQTSDGADIAARSSETRISNSTNHTDSDKPNISSSDKSSCMEMVSYSSQTLIPICPCEVLQFLLPGLCHLTAEDKARRVLIEERAHVVLLDYFHWQWQSLQQADKSQQAQETLVTLCGVFLNLAVLEGAFVGEDQTFRDLMVAVSSFVSSPVLKESHLVLRMNLSVLGLMLLQNQGQHSDLSDEDIEKFFDKTIRWLNQARCRLKIAGGGCMLAVSESYQRVWDQVSELWFLGMQVLASCVSQFPCVAKMVLKSGWLPNSVKNLLDAKGCGVDEETQKAYQDLMCALAHEDKQARDVLLQKGAQQLVSLYKMEELSASLQS